MKERIRITLLCLCLVLLTACGTKRKEERHPDGFFVYYLTTEGNALEKQEYEMTKQEQAGQIEELLQALHKTPDSIELKAALSGDLKVTSYEVEDGQLQLHFNEAYGKLKKSTEVLVRAAVVKTMVQATGIDYVSFFVGEQALLGKNDVPVGLMSEDSFVQSQDSYLGAYQTAELELYFPDQAGNQLVSETRSEVHYSLNTSMEKLVVEQLLKGPQKSDKQKVLSADVALVGVSVKEGICYVTFSKEFLKAAYNQSPETTIYSIVNSIIKNGNALKVQLLVEGDPEAIYLNAIPLNQPLEWNADLIKEEP